MNRDKVETDAKRLDSIKEKVTKALILGNVLNNSTIDLLNNFDIKNALQNIKNINTKYKKYKVSYSYGSGGYVNPLMIILDAKNKYNYGDGYVRIWIQIEQ